MIQSVSSPAAAAAVYPKTGNYQGNYRLDSQTNTVSRTDDTVRISRAGRIASLFDEAGLIGTGNVITLDDIQAVIDSDTDYVQTRLKAIANELGIDSASEIRLEKDFAGYIVVKGDASCAETLEKRLNGDDEFSRRFSRLSANSSVLKAAKEYIVFSKEYEKNPEAAVMKYSYLFYDNHRYDASFIFKNGVLTEEDSPRS